jgi:hypothetical protein
MTSVRLADKIEDMPAIVAIVLEFIDQAGLGKYMPDDLPARVAAIETVINYPVVDVLLSLDDSGAVIGGLGINYSPLLWNMSMTVGEELFLWVAPFAPATAAMRLMKAGQAQMRERGVRTQVWSALPDSPPKIGKVYERMGCALSQLTYIGKF